MPARALAGESQIARERHDGARPALRQPAHHLQANWVAQCAKDLDGSHYFFSKYAASIPMIIGQPSLMWSVHRASCSAGSEANPLSTTRTRVSLPAGSKWYSTSVLLCLRGSSSPTCGFSGPITQ